MAVNDKNWYVPLKPKTPINQQDQEPQGNNLDGFWSTQSPEETADEYCGCGSGEKRLYCQCPYLKYPCSVFIIKQYAVFPLLKANVYQQQGLFGDSLPFCFDEYNIYFYIYDENDYLRVQGQGQVSNSKTGEISYVWKLFETQEKGNYYCEVKLIKADNEITLPGKQNRFEIKII